MSVVISYSSLPFLIMLYVLPLLALPFMYQSKHLLFPSPRASNSLDPFSRIYTRIVGPLLRTHVTHQKFRMKIMTFFFLF